MLKKFGIAFLALFFALFSAGVLVQMTSAGSDFGSGVSQTVPTRTPGPGTVPTRTPQPAAHLRVYHFADIAAGDAPLDVTLGGEQFATLNYGESTQYMEVDVGTALLEITVSTGRSVLTIPVSQTVTFSNSEYYTVILSGDEGTNQPTTIDIFVDDNSAPAAGKAKIRVGHFAPFDNDIANTQVDLREKGSGSIIGGLDDVQYGVLSPYFELNANIEYDLIVTNADGTVTVLDVPPVTFADGEIATIIVGGGGANQPLAIVVSTNIRELYLPVIFK